MMQVQLICELNTYHTVPICMLADQFLLKQIILWKIQPLKSESILTLIKNEITVIKNEITENYW